MQVVTSLTCNASGLELFFYTCVLCVGEPVLLPHRARCRWGPRLQLPLALLV